MGNIELENMIDKSNLAQVIQDLVDICYGKAEHLRVNWQDESAAKGWDKAAAKLESIIAKLPEQIAITK